MVGTLRPEEIGLQHPLAVLQQQLKREGLCRPLHLERLSSEAVTAMVQEMSGAGEVVLPLAHRLYRETEGNPFFLIEIIKALFETEVVRLEEGAWQGDLIQISAETLPLPAGVSEAIQDRVHRLDGETQEALRLAAVLGHEFDFDLLDTAWGRDTEETLGALDDLLRHRLIDEGTGMLDRDYAFTHHKIQEVIYADIPRRRRQHMHGLIGATMEQLYEPQLVMSELAFHFEHAQRSDKTLTEKAIIYLRGAGEQAAAQFAHAEAIAYFSRAIDLTPGDEQARQYTILMAREKVYDVQGAREEQKRDLATLQRLAEALADDVPPPAGGSRRAEVGLRQAHYDETTGNYPAAIAAAQEAIRLSQAVGDVDNEAAGYLQWGMVLWHQGEYQAAQLRFEQALSLARTEGLRQVEADGLSSLGLVAWTQGDYDGARACSEQALPIYRELGNRQGEGRVLNSLGIVLIEQGNYAESNIHYEQALQTVREIGDRRRESYVLGNVANAFVMQGNYAQARIHFEQSMYIACEIGDRHSEGAARNNLSWTFHLLGDDEAACEHGRQALLILREIGNRRNEGYALTNLGHALTGLGNLKEAAESYQQALALRRELGQHNLAIESLAGLARVSLAQGDLEQAQAQVEKILAFLETETLDGTEEPFRVYLTCYRVLCANQDPRAKTILNTAHCLLQEQAAKISDEETRCSFLENVAAHREIVNEWRKESSE